MMSRREMAEIVEKARIELVTMTKSTLPADEVVLQLDKVREALAPIIADNCPDPLENREKLKRQILGTHIALILLAVLIVVSVGGMNQIFSDLANPHILLFSGAFIVAFVCSGLLCFFSAQRLSQLDGMQQVNNLILNIVKTQSFYYFAIRLKGGEEAANVLLEKMRQNKLFCDTVEAVGDMVFTEGRQEMFEGISFPTDIAN